MNTATWAIIVTYQPDPALLARLLVSLAPQVAGGVVINNGQSLPLTNAQLLEYGFHCQHLGHNAGIAAALNQGIQWCQAQGATHIISFDQDSEPAADMVEHLQHAYQQLSANGQAIAAVGPCYEDRKTGEVAPLLAADTHPDQYRKMMPAPETGVVEVDMLITSGALMAVEVLDQIGLMREELFIDHVDMEWCFRARHRGYSVYAVGDARLYHSIGDRVMKLLSRKILVHSPIRHYYMLRNGIALQKLPHMTSRWCRNMTLTLIKQFVFYSIFLPQRRQRIRLMLRGLYDGWRQHMGPLSQ